jgi:hypothetical protein
MQTIMDAVKSSTDIIFGGSKRGSLAARNGLFPSHVNKYLDYYGVPSDIRFAEKIPLSDQADAWRSWETNSPLDVLDKVHAAHQRALIDVTVGREFSNEFGSAATKPGYSRITDRAGQSTLFKFIDTEKFYPNEIIRQIPYADAFLSGTAAHIKNPTASKLIKKYDAILHAWKSGVTIYRPGHHISNAMGDITLAWLAGVNNPLVYETGMRILRGRSELYGGPDGLKALVSDTGLAGKSAGSIKVGKLGELSHDAVWRGAYNQGLLPDFRVLEDISFNEGQAFGKLGGLSWRKPFGGKIQKAAGGLSQTRDHWIRISHFVDALQKSKANTIEDAVKEAGAVVRKWHPDGSDLTATERQVMRRLIPFYAWMRKSAPLAVEAAVMTPGKTLVIPKAMYNFSTAMGINPDSLGDPFPMTGLYPEFLTDQSFGPQWKGTLLGISGLGQYSNRQYGFSLPGDPVSSTGGGLFTNPKPTILGGITPALRVPLELATGSQLGTGSSIADKTDYADSQIPGVSIAANITNRSITGLGQPQNDVAKGYQAPGVDKVSIANFLLGLGIKDYSKPNYTKRAQFELRDKIKAANNG